MAEQGSMRDRTERGSMRERMPKVAAWVDALRQAFGQAHIDECIRRGMVSAGGAWEFRANENGHFVGRTGEG